MFSDFFLDRKEFDFIGKVNSLNGFKDFCKDCKDYLVVIDGARWYVRLFLKRMFIKRYLIC